MERRDQERPSIITRSRSRSSEPLDVTRPASIRISEIYLSPNLSSSMGMSWKDSVYTVLERDPAARSFKEALWFSPGLHAILLQKISHQQFMKGNFMLARAINYFGRFLTGADIHPGATDRQGILHRPRHRGGHRRDHHHRGERLHIPGGDAGRRQHQQGKAPSHDRQQRDRRRRGDRAGEHHHRGLRQDRCRLRGHQGRAPELHRGGHTRPGGQEGRRPGASRPTCATTSCRTRCATPSDHIRKDYRNWTAGLHCMEEQLKKQKIPIRCISAHGRCHHGTVTLQHDDQAGRGVRTHR